MSLLSRRKEAIALRYRGNDKSVFQLQYYTSVGADEMAGKPGILTLVTIAVPNPPIIKNKGDYLIYFSPQGERQQGDITFIIDNEVSEANINLATEILYGTTTYKIEQKGMKPFQNEIQKFIIVCKIKS